MRNMLKFHQHIPVKRVKKELRTLSPLEELEDTILIKAQ